MLTTNPDRVQNVKISNVSSGSCKSDHFLVEFYYTANSCPRIDKSSRFIYQYSRGDYAQMDCFPMDRHLGYTTCDIKQMWSLFKSEVVEACNLFVPKVKRSSHNPPK